MNAENSKAPPILAALATRAERPESLEELTPDQVAAVDAASRFFRLVGEYDRRLDLARIDPNAELEAFLSSARGASTRKAYAAGLRRFGAWCEASGLHPMAVTPGQADDYLNSLQSLNLSAATLRQIQAAASSFFTWLGRRHAWIRNPFLGTRQGARRQASKEILVPTTEEVRRLLEILPAPEAAFLSFLAFVGLRVDGTAAVTLREDRYTTRSKGKDLVGTVPAEVLGALSKADLSKTRPFEERPSESWRNRLSYLIRQAKKTGVVRFAYSPHSFRHYYALAEYETTKDLYRLQRLLGHSSITTTTEYLRRLR